MCSKSMYYLYTNHDIISATNGTWAFCYSGAICSICRSGKNADCSGSHAKLLCAIEALVNHSKCSY